MPHNKYMPQYHCWSENDFQADRQVQRMPYPARRLYRALLQAAFTCPTRPYLPADDEKLYLLAEADDLEYWILHKEPVLKMFAHFKDEDGADLLERDRLTRDWQQMTETIAQKQKTGRARHGKSAYAEWNSADIEQRAGDALKLKTETKIQTETKVKQNSNIKNQFRYRNGTRFHIQMKRSGFSCLQMIQPLTIYLPHGQPYRADPVRLKTSKRSWKDMKFL